MLKRPPLPLLLVAERLAPGVRERVGAALDVGLLAARQGLDPGVLRLGDLAPVFVLVLDRGVLRRVDELARRIDAGVLQVLVDVRHRDGGHDADDRDGDDDFNEREARLRGLLGDVLVSHVLTPLTPTAPTAIWLVSRTGSMTTLHKA